MGGWFKSQTGAGMPEAAGRCPSSPGVRGGPDPAAALSGRFNLMSTTVVWWLL